MSSFGGDTHRRLSPRGTADPRGAGPGRRTCPAGLSGSSYRWLWTLPRPLPLSRRILPAYARYVQGFSVGVGRRTAYIGKRRCIMAAYKRVSLLITRKDDSTGGSDKLGTLPEWNLADLYSAPDGPDLARDL